MVSKWQELVDAGSSDSLEIELTHWTSRATLDAIGGTIFLLYSYSLFQ